jgi:hypothetical protein
MSVALSMFAEDPSPPFGDMGMVVRSTCSDIVLAEMCGSTYVVTGVTWMCGGGRPSSDGRSAVVEKLERENESEVILEQVWNVCCSRGRCYVYGARKARA